MRTPSRSPLTVELLEQRNLLTTFYGGYRTVEGIAQSLAEMAKNYPNITEIVDYGDSYSKTVNGVTTPGGEFIAGYDLLAVQVTNKAIAGPKPVLVVLTGVHAREITTPEISLRFLDWLTQGYGTDPDATWLVDYHEIWVLPLANPDGHWYVELGELPPYSGNPWLWRKNGHPAECAWPAPGGNGYGVDLNRNYSFRWGGVGSSPNPCEQTYRGESAASEPETAAVQALVSSLIPDQRGDDESEPAPDNTTGMMLDLHTTGGLVLWPWSHIPDPPPNLVGLSAIGRKLASYNGYTAGQTYQTLYASTGSSKDWGYGELGIPSYTIEMDSGSFLAQYSTVDGRVWPQMRDPLIYAAKLVRTPYRTVHGPDALGVQAIVDGKYLYVLTTLDEQRTGRQTVAAAEFYIDTPPWVEGAKPLPLYAGNEIFDSMVEDAYGYALTEGLTPGRHIVYVRGQDDEGNWGPISAAFFDVGEPSPSPGGGDFLRSLVRDGVGDAGVLEPLAPQPAAIAPATGPTLPVRVIAAQGQRVIDAEADAFADDLRLAQAKQRGMDRKSTSSLDGGLRGEVGEPLELSEELGAAIGIA